MDQFDRKRAAEDWAKETETKIKNGKYDFTKNREKTVVELIDLYIQDAVIGHHKAADDTIFQLNYFKEKIGKYALTYITPEVLIAQRKELTSFFTDCVIITVRSGPKQAQVDYSYVLN